VVSAITPAESAWTRSHYDSQRRLETRIGTHRIS
jgi:hypothetical protein